MVKPFSSSGVLGVARCESFTTLGREASADACWPQATTQYKGDRSLRRSVEDSAGPIVLLESRNSNAGLMGRGPTSVSGSRCN